MPLEVENYTLGNFSGHFPTRNSEMPPCTRDTDTIRVFLVRPLKLSHCGTVGVLKKE